MAYEGKDYPQRILSKNLEIHILELKKYKKQKKTGKTDAWLEFFINPYGEEVLKMARTYEELRAAVEQLNMLEADEEVRNLADAEAWARYDRMQQDAELREKAIAEGLAEGKAKGLAEGRAEGRAEGQVIGETKTKKEIAKKMKEIGMSLEKIKNITYLSEDEIKKL